MNTTTSHVSRISIARLYNLGDYEHARYEVTVEVPEGADAAVTFQNLEEIVEALNPKCPINEYNLRAAQTWIEKSDEQKEQCATGELGFEGGSDRQAIDAWLERREADALKAIHANNEHQLRRDMAIAALKDLGGAIK
jgi:hypothetical protein